MCLLFSLGAVLLLAAAVACSRFGLDPAAARWSGLYPFLTSGIAVIVVGCDIRARNLTVPLMITGLGLVWQLFVAVR
jgi:hypothetical protein